jgi:hypothetical protein
MDIKKIATEFIVVFAITFLVTLGVTFLWSLIIHGSAIIDWETAFRFATIFGIIFPIINSRNGNRSGK